MKNHLEELRNEQGMSKEQLAEVLKVFEETINPNRDSFLCFIYK